MDQDMAVLTEMVQTGLYIQELSQFVAALLSVSQVEDRNAKLRRDIENCLVVLVEAMVEGLDLPRVELEA